MEQKKIHPLIPEAQELLRQNKITRREFLRFSVLLGMSVAGAKFLAACAQQPTPTEMATEALPTAAPATAVPTMAATEAPKSGVVRGGVMCGQQLELNELIIRRAFPLLASRTPGGMCLTT